MSCAHPCPGGPASAKAKIVSLRIMTIFRDLGSQRGLPTASRCWTEDPQGRRFAGIGPGGDEQPVEVGNKQRGSRAGYRGNVRRAAICVPLRLEYIQVSVPAAHINALALRIEEEIVGIAACIDHGNGAAIPQREHT